MQTCPGILHSQTTRNACSTRRDSSFCSARKMRDLHVHSLNARTSTTFQPVFNLKSRRSRETTEYIRAIFRARAGKWKRLDDEEPMKTAGSRNYDNPRAIARFCASGTDHSDALARTSGDFKKNLIIIVSLIRRKSFSDVRTFEEKSSFATRLLSLSRFNCKVFYCV